MQNPNGRIIFDTVKQFFTGDNWPFTQAEGEPVLQMAFEGTHGRWMCFAQAREDAQQIVFYSVSPVIVPVEKRQAMAEFLTRANYGLIIGNFEMDFDDGEMRYKTGIDVEGAEPNTELIRSLAYANVMTMDRYLPGALSVIYGDASPAEAISKLED
jgi:hypothetical protein